MIFTLFLDFAYWILTSILSIFPASSGFPSEVHSAFSYFGGYVNMLDVLVPVDTLLICVGLVSIFEISVFGFKTFKWILSHIPFIGGRG